MQITGTAMTTNRPPIMFRDFRSYVCEGDAVSVTHEGVTYTATIHRDDISDAPDERQDGFWPSLDKSDAGYIGAKSKRTLARHMARAQSIMDAWKADEWFFCGVTISATIEDDEGEEVSLGDHLASLWGIECNYPSHDKRRTPNAYLSECANDLLCEAIDQAQAERARIHAATAPLVTA